MAWSRESQAFVKKSLGTALLLFAVSAASGAPTINSSNGYTARCAVSTSRNEQAFFVPELTQAAESCNPQLAAVAAEFLRPPADFTGPAASFPAYVKPLPAVPGAVFMVLVGFLCVSLVKDRKVWLAALAGLLWAGQAGVQAVPQLVLHLGHRNHIEQQLHPEITYPYDLENSDRLRSDVEGTQYIGLLHHLAGIPKDTMLLPSPVSLPSLRAQRRNLNAAFNRLTSTQTEERCSVSQCAIIQLSSYLTSATNCLAFKAEQLICFSPAFIFERMPRGPPNPA